MIQAEQPQQRVQVAQLEQTLPRAKSVAPAARRVRPEWIIAGAFAIVALGFNLYRLGAPSVWFDESFSYGLSGQSFPVMLRYIWGPFQNMALYYVFLHFWLGATALAGLAPSAFVLRLPSAIFAAFGTTAVFLFGWRFFGKTAGLVAGALTLVSGLQIFGAQQMRAYSLQMLFLVISWYALFAALSSPSYQQRKRWWLVYVGAIVLAIYAHLFSTLILGAQVAALIALWYLPGPWQALVRRSRRLIILSLCLVAILSYPIMVDAGVNGGLSTWVPPAKLSYFYTQLALPLANSNAIYLAALGLAGFIALAVTGWLTYTSGKGQQSEAQPDAPPATVVIFRQPAPGVFFLACWLVIPVVVSFALTQNHLNLHLFTSRYLMVAVPPLSLLVGVGVASLRWTAARVVAGLLLVALAVSTAPSYYASAQVEDFTTTSHWVETHYQPGDGLICFPEKVCAMPLEYYLQPQFGAAQFDSDSPGRWDWPGYVGIPIDPPTVEAYAMKHQRVFFINASLTTTADLQTQLATEQQWLSAHAKLVGQYIVSPITISLYDLSQPPTS